MPLMSLAQLRPIVELLERAQRECTARGNQAPHPLDDQAIWHLDAAKVWVAAETLRSVLDEELPRVASIQLLNPRLQPGGEDPLQLLQEAWTHLVDLPQDVDNAALALGLLRFSDALAGVRTHYA